MRRRKRKTFKSFCRFAKNRSSRIGAPPYMMNAGENCHSAKYIIDPASTKSISNEECTTLKDVNYTKDTYAHRLTSSQYTLRLSHLYERQLIKSRFFRHIPDRSTSFQPLKSSLTAMIFPVASIANIAQEAANTTSLRQNSPCYTQSNPA